MNTLPAIPKPGAVISPADIEQIEQHVAREIAGVEDVAQLQEWQAQAAALASYLKGKELHAPMLGAQRRVEARIGQLLGECPGHGPGRGGEKVTHESSLIPSHDRQRFRLLARGLDHALPDQVWRQSRRALIEYLQKTYPVPRHVPTVMTKEGAVRKPIEQRAKEIQSLAASGHRATQIAAKIGIGEENVRRLAKKSGIELPDAAMGNTRRLNAHRILSETVNGVDAYVSGLSLLDGLELPQLAATEIAELVQAVARSINGLKKLRARMEKTYAGTNTSAA